MDVFYYAIISIFCFLASLQCTWSYVTPFLYLCVRSYKSVLRRTLCVKKFLLMTQCLKIFPGTLRAFSRVWARDFAGASPGPVARRRRCFAIRLALCHWPSTEKNTQRSIFPGCPSPNPTPSANRVTKSVCENFSMFTNTYPRFSRIMLRKVAGKTSKGRKSKSQNVFFESFVFVSTSSLTLLLFCPLNTFNARRESEGEKSICSIVFFTINHIHVLSSFHMLLSHCY